MNYKIAEIFLSIQGEGKYTGVPMVFIRLAGCNINCEFCDTNYKERSVMSEGDILNLISLHYSTRRVCLTGGEPLMQDVELLCKKLHYYGHKIHLETNGSFPIRYELFDHVVISPKSMDVTDANLYIADEIKLLYGTEDFEKWTKRATSNVFDLNADLLVMPLETNSFLLTQQNKKDALKFVLANPRFKLCAQLQKLYSFK